MNVKEGFIIEWRRSMQKDTYISIIFWTSLLLALFAIIIDSIPANTAPQTDSEQAVLPSTSLIDLEISEADVKISQYVREINENLVPNVFEAVKLLMEFEDERFKALDAKASTFVGMLSIAMAFLGSSGAIGFNILKPDTQSKIRLAKETKKRIYILYNLVLLSFLMSTFYAVGSTRIPTWLDNIMPWQTIERYSTSPNMILDPIAVKNKNKNKYLANLAGEYAKVYVRNYKANNIKTSRLSSSQTWVMVGGMFLLFLLMILTIELTYKPPNKT